MTWTVEADKGARKAINNTSNEPLFFNTQKY